MATPPVDLRLDLSRVFPVDPARLYRFFADGPMLARWWGPRGFSVGSIDFDPYPGSRYGIEMRPPDGAPFRLTGTFRDVAPADRLAFTFRWDPPDADDVETLAELSFRDFGTFTEVVLTQGSFKTEERRDLHRQGWAESFDRLERLVTPHGAG